jgi:membrane-associated phospholipid phosphatase
MSRSRLYGIPTLALIAAMATACSEQSTAPASRAATNEGAGSGLSELAGRLSSVGWQERARSLVAANNMSPLAAARVFAALSVAQYRAVMAIHDSDVDGQLPEEGLGAGGRSALEARRGAVAGASVQVLSFFFPAAAESLEQVAHLEGESGAGDVHPQFVGGLAIGRDAGDALVDRARNDHFTTPWTGTVPVGPGVWVANGPPAGAALGGVTPYLLSSGDQFRPPPPPAFGSAAFLSDLNEIRGLALNRTPAQQAIALYWNFPTGTFTPVGFWNLAASHYVEQYSLDERAATRAFALTHAAMMDALIGCWDAKYYYWSMRPSQADPLITLSFGLPNHPSYPSGHSCASAAAATILGSLFPEQTQELSTWVTEAGQSRMYGGIHYRFDITAGAQLGDAVARWAIAHAGVLD